MQLPQALTCWASSGNDKLLPIDFQHFSTLDGLQQQLINSFAASVYILMDVSVRLYIAWPDKSTGDKLMLQMKCNCWHRTRERNRGPTCPG